MHPLRRKHSDSTLLNLYCVRHAQAGSDHVWRYEPEQIKKKGLPLSDCGKRQALRLSTFIEDISFDHMYTSDLLRAYETTEIIAQKNKSASVNVMQDLREVHAWHVEGGVEPSEKQLTRERARVAAISEMLQSYVAGEHVLIVGHGNFLRFLLAHLSGCDPMKSISLEMYNASLTTAIRDESGRLRIQEMNNTQFLEAQDVTVI